ncbi:MAG: amidohydrolase family protein [bacterium]|nr:amidohydrolase family protein [bacterium]
MTMPRIDTHSHFNPPIGDLRAIVRSFDNFEHNDTMSNSRNCAAGCRKMYGVDAGPLLRSDAPDVLFEKAAALRAKPLREALEQTFDADAIEQQIFLVGGFRPESAPVHAATPRGRLLPYIDQALLGNDMAFCPDGRHLNFNYYDALCGHFGGAQSLASLDDYLGHLDQLIDGWGQHGVVGMKTAIAYTIGLSIGNPTSEAARAAFARKRDMSSEEVRTVQHYAFHHALGACLRNGFPVVIHTGFQIWGHSDLRQSNPMHLHPLLIDERYKDLTFVLLHGGNPYVGETTYLARMFPNVIIDFTWISWMTRARFRWALAEWIEIIRPDKFCWGSDSNLPENIVGIGQVTREEIANVLEDLIARRIIDDKVAEAFLENTYLKTPKRVFGI